MGLRNEQFSHELRHNGFLSAVPKANKDNELGVLLF